MPTEPEASLSRAESFTAGRRGVDRRRYEIEIDHIAKRESTVTENTETKGERRERKRRQSRKMRVTGVSVRKLQEIIFKKSRDGGRSQAAPRDKRV